MTQVEKSLQQAKAQGCIVRFARTFEPGTMTGFVINLGPSFFMLELLAEDFGFEQFTCIRMRDVRQLSCPATNSAFYLRARRALGHKRVRPPKIDLQDASTILSSAKSPLVAIHKEVWNSDVCFIGVPTTVSSGKLVLKEIGPDGVWDDEETTHLIRQITRIDFPGPYERALLAGAIVRHTKHGAGVRTPDGQ